MAIKTNNGLAASLFLLLGLISWPANSAWCVSDCGRASLQQWTVEQYYKSPERLLEWRTWTGEASYSGHTNEPINFIGIGDYFSFVILCTCSLLSADHLWSQLAENYENKRGVQTIKDYLGNKMAEASFDKNGATGQFRVWFANGKLAQEGGYKNDLKDGIFKLWHANGQLMYEGLYQNDKAVDLHTSWHRNGEKWFEKHYEDGRIIYTAWFKDGHLSSTTDECDTTTWDIATTLNGVTLKVDQASKVIADMGLAGNTVTITNCNSTTVSIERDLTSGASLTATYDTSDDSDDSLTLKSSVSF